MKKINKELDELSTEEFSSLLNEVFSSTIKMNNILRKLHHQNPFSDIIAEEETSEQIEERKYIEILSYVYSIEGNSELNMELDIDLDA